MDRQARKVVDRIFGLQFTDDTIKAGGASKEKGWKAVKRKVGKQANR